MKKLIAMIICIVLAFSFVLYGCDVKTNTGKTDQDVKDQQLSTPEITLTDNVLTWGAIENAICYKVLKDNCEVATVSEATYTITDEDVGTYQYSVYAVAGVGFSDSKVSNTVAFTVQQKGDDPIITDQKSTTLLSTSKIYVVGDSTVCDYSSKPDNYYLQRYGYGTQLYRYLNLSNQNQIVNLALSGRSSLSFLTEQNYQTLKNNIKEGDYLIIGFGHNDEKSDDAERFTDPIPSYTEASSSKGPSFKYTLYNNYIKLAKDVGATPILCTPIVRYNEKGVYQNNSYVHVTENGDYASAIIQLGKDTDTAVVDLTGITTSYYKDNNSTAKYLHAFTTYSGEKPNETPDGMDGTHINMYGAKTIAYWLLNNLPNDCSLKNHVLTSTEVSAPTYDVDYPLAINNEYVKPTYTPFNAENYESNKVATTVCNGTSANWYKTAMGVLGGATKTANYQFSYADETFTVNTDVGSKIASTQDGFGAIFVQVNVNDNFTATAKATVKQMKKDLDQQMSFGMMLRDDILIDKQDTTLASNYVAAGLLNGTAIFSREQTSALTKTSNQMAIAVDKEYQLTITRVGQVVEVTVVSDGVTYTQKFTDFSFVGVDNNYMYLCLYANRGLVVEFSDVNFEITGVAQGA